MIIPVKFHKNLTVGILEVDFVNCNQTDGRRAITQVHLAFNQ